MKAELSLPSGSPISCRRTPKLLGCQRGGKYVHVSKASFVNCQSKKNQASLGQKVSSGNVIL